MIVPDIPAVMTHIHPVVPYIHSIVISIPAIKISLSLSLRGNSKE
jgi:hypothetical protein